MQNEASQEQRDPRIQSGLAWLKVVGIVILISIGVRTCTTVANWDAFSDPGFKLFGIILGSIGAFIILGAPAFGLGWFFGGKKNNETEAPESNRTVQKTLSSITGVPASSYRDTTMALTDDEQFWAKALAEYESNARRPGLYARSFAQADGNESIAKATYIKHRAEELALEHQEHVCAQRQAELEAMEKARLAALTEEERAYEMLPKGHCPNCKAVIPISAEECPKCRASFGAGSAWQIAPIRNV
jgi:hypothetical protein